MQAKESFFDIKKTVRAGVPSLPLQAMAHGILGSRYRLSVVICGDKLARKINKAYRKKTYAANVLSFPLSKEEGEIFLNVRKAAREARSLGISHRKRLALLYVHGCFHLKNMRHGDAMELAEETVLRKYGLLG